MTEEATGRDLSILQQWVYRSITHPSDVARGAADAATALHIEKGSIRDFIKPSATLNAADRLTIYRNAYHLRLMDVLEAEYPALKLALGADLFGKFALFFLQQNPPASYTLYDLSAGFPDFLKETAPQEDAAMGWPAFIIDLARLERMFQEIYRGPGTEQGQALTLQRWRALAPLERDEFPLLFAPCLRLMESAYPVHEFLIAARRNREVEWRSAEPSYLAICRLQYNVKIHVLTFDEYAFLSSLQKAAHPHRTVSVPLEKWIAEGFFIAGVEKLARPEQSPAPGPRREDYFQQ